ncbi:MAG: hypothetical protein PHH08_02465, partial [Candidatus ainarchaeum sp.]|nr:hypothetical protein [Candidatus ainarchaeum sp.]
MQIARKTRVLLHSTPIEIAKGAIKGQAIRITNPARYRELKAIRPDRRGLVQNKKRILELVKNACTEARLKPIKIFGVIKTIGSIDRKERRARLLYPETLREIIKEDFVGITIVV